MRNILLTSILLLLLYVCSYAAFFCTRVPAGNLAYWVYLHGGGEKVQREEWALYYLYYPPYKVCRIFGAGRHNYDRGYDPNSVYDGDEPKK